MSSMSYFERRAAEQKRQAKASGVYQKSTEELLQNKLISENDALKAENERLKAENAALRGCDGPITSSHPAHPTSIKECWRHIDNLNRRINDVEASKYEQCEILRKKLVDLEEKIRKEAACTEEHARAEEAAKLPTLAVEIFSEASAETLAIANDSEYSIETKTIIDAKEVSNSEIGTIYAYNDERGKKISSAKKQTLFDVETRNNGACAEFYKKLEDGKYEKIFSTDGLRKTLTGGKILSYDWNANDVAFDEDPEIIKKVSFDVENTNGKIERIVIAISISYDVIRSCGDGSCDACRGEDSYDLGCNAFTNFSITFLGKQIKWLISYNSH